MNREKLLESLMSLLEINQDDIEKRAKLLQKEDARWPIGMLSYKENAKIQLQKELASKIISCVISPHLQEAAYLIESKARALSHQIISNTNEVVKKITDQQITLPPNVIGHRIIDGYEYVLIQEPPKIRSLKISMAYHRPTINFNQRGCVEEDSVETFRLAMPYILYYIVFRESGQFVSFRMFFRNQPIQSIDDNLHLAPLPNMKSDGSTCNPWEMMECFNSKILSLADRINRTLSFFWGTTFNYYLHNPSLPVVENGDKVKTFKEWEEKSKENPLFVLNTKWKGTELRLNRLFPDVNIKLSNTELNKYINETSRLLRI